MNMYINSISPLSYQLLATPQTPQKETSIPVHLRYMSGPRGELFRALVEKRILDPYGKITPEYSNVSLPPLTSEEFAFVTQELGRKFKITLDDAHVICVSMHEILNSFLTNVSHYRRDLYCRSIRMIGSYVPYLLFFQTDYAQRVFNRLNINDLWSKDFFYKAKESADIGLRIHLERYPDLNYNSKLRHDDLKHLRDLIIWQLSCWFIDNQRKINQENIQTAILSQAFRSLYTISTQSIRMQILSLKQSSIDWILFQHLPRDYVFTVDDLYLDPLSNTPVSLESHRKQPLESFFHYVLGFTDTENITTMCAKEWFRYLSWIMKGNCNIYVPKQQSDPHLEPYLFSQVDTDWLQPDQQRVSKIQMELKKWIEKYYLKDTLAAFAFTFNMCLHLQGRLLNKEIQEILKAQLSALSFEEKEIFLVLIKKLICDQNVSLEMLTCVLKIAAFQAHSRQNPFKKSVQVEMRTDAFRCPVMHLQIESHTIQLDLKIHEALQNLQNIPADVHKNLSQLFFFICPPSRHQKKYNQEFFNDIGIDLENVTNSARNLVKSTHPFFIYIGLAILFGNSSQSPSAIRQLAERGVVPILEFVEDKEAVRQELIQFIGSDSIPRFSDHRFLEKWMSILFEHGRDSEQTAFELWEQFPPSADSFVLIKKLCSSQPAFALRLFAQMKLEDFPNEAFACILACGSIVKRLKIERSDHTALINFMATKIPGLLEHKHTKPQNAKFLSVNLNWYAQRFQSEIIARDGLKLGYFLKSQTQACRRLTLLSDLAGIFSKLPASFLEAQALFKRATTQKILSKEKQLNYLLQLYETNPVNDDPDIFSLLIDLGNSSILNKEQKEKIVKIIFANIEKQDFKAMQRCVTRVQLVLKNLENSLPPSFNRAACIQCYLRKIDLPQSMSRYWFEVLKAWCKEENPDYQIIYNLLLDAERRGYTCDEVSFDVKLTLAKGWKDHTEFSERSYQLMQDLIPHLSEQQVDRTQFYRLLEDFILRRKCLNLLDSIADKDPNPPYILILDAISTFCLDKKKLKHLLAWLNTTHFFDALQDREKFRGLVKVMIAMGLHFAEQDARRTDWVSLLYTFVIHYPDDLQAVDSKTWGDFLSFLEQAKKPHLLIEIYYLIDKRKLLKEESSIFFSLYSTVLRTMIQRTDPRLPKILMETAKHKKLCKSINNELAIFTHSYFIKGAIQCSDPEPLIKPVREVYALSKVCLSELALKALDVERIESVIDFTYVQFLCRTQSISLGLNRLNEILNTKHLSQYWNQADTLINTFVIMRNPTLLKYIDRLFEITDPTTLPGLDIQKLIPFLLDHPTKERYIHSSNLLLSAISTKKILKPSKEIWCFIRRIMKGMLKEKEYVHTGQLSFFVNENFQVFQKAVGKDFLDEASEIFLLQSLQGIGQQRANVLSGNIDAVVSYLHISGKTNEEILVALHDGLIKLSQIDFPLFSKSVNAFMCFFVVKTNQTEKMKDKLALPTDECFGIKYHLIEALISALKPDHPFANELSLKIKSYLNLLMCEEFKEKKEELLFLLRSYWEKANFLNKKNGRSS